jgi:hypothetical protein
MRACSPTEAKIRADAYTVEWIESVCSSVWKSLNLRHSITLAAALLTELLELEVDLKGWDQEWKDNLAAFCAMMSERLEDALDERPHEDEVRELNEWAWSTAEEVLRIYGRMHAMSDWEIYAELCLHEREGEEIYDKEDFARWIYSLSVAYVHGYVTELSDHADA